MLCSPASWKLFSIPRSSNRIDSDLLLEYSFGFANRCKFSFLRLNALPWGSSAGSYPTAQPTKCKTRFRNELEASPTHAAQLEDILLIAVSVSLFLYHGFLTLQATINLPIRMQPVEPQMTVFHFPNSVL